MYYIATTLAAASIPYIPLLDNSSIQWRRRRRLRRRNEDEQDEEILFRWVDLDIPYHRSVNTLSINTIHYGSHIN